MRTVRARSLARLPPFPTNPKAGDAFPLELAYPVGSVVAHGGTKAYKRIRASIQTGNPMVLLYNSGGVTQAFGSLHRALLRQDGDAGGGGGGATGGGETDEPGGAPSDLLGEIEYVAEENWVKSFGVPEVMLFQELHKRAPALFHKSIVTVDLVNDSAEEVLQTITGSFASAGGGLPELGLGAAEVNVVLSAWSRHLALSKTARYFAWRASLVSVALFSISLLTALVAVLYAAAQVTTTRAAKNPRAVKAVTIDASPPFG